VIFIFVGKIESEVLFDSVLIVQQPLDQGIGKCFIASAGSGCDQMNIVLNNFAGKGMDVEAISKLSFGLQKHLLALNFVAKSLRS